MASGLQKLNELAESDATALLLTVCGSRRWASEMARLRPFADLAAVLRSSDAAGDRLTREDWLEAFSHHPRIGETNLSQQKFAATREQSGREQWGMAGASDEVRRAFLEGNRQYEARFGHVFLICATGKSGQEMLDQLRARMNNDAATELRNAIGEQRLITTLRLERMLQS